MKEVRYWCLKMVHLWLETPTNLYFSYLKIIKEGVCMFLYTHLNSYNGSRSMFCNDIQNRSSNRTPFCHCSVVLWVCVGVSLHGPSWRVSSCRAGTPGGTNYISRYSRKNKEQEGWSEQKKACVTRMGQQEKEELHGHMEDLAYPRRVTDVWLAKCYICSEALDMWSDLF